jgi:hypothetical protein
MGPDCSGLQGHVTNWRPIVGGRASWPEVIAGSLRVPGSTRQASDVGGWLICMARGPGNGYDGPLF